MDTDEHGMPIHGLVALGGPRGDGTRLAARLDFAAAPELRAGGGSPAARFDDPPIGAPIAVESRRRRG